MDVLFIARDADLGNGGYKLQKCLEKVGIDSLAVQMKAHKYNYPEQAEICTYDQILAYVKQAKIIIFMSSNYFDVGNLENKRVFVFHRGWRYRNNKERMNKFFNSFVEGTLFTSPDLMGYGAKKEHWISFPVDTEYLLPVYPNNDKLRIAHFPANASKGTEIIIPILEDLKEEGWNIEVSHTQGNYLDWSDYIKELSKCDIYIERCCTSCNGQKTGEWGNTAVEAAALGKIVVASFLSRDRYESEFAYCPIQVANTAVELEEMLRYLIQMDLDELKKLKERTVSWVRECHSYESIGRRLKGVIWND